MEIIGLIGLIIIILFIISACIVSHKVSEEEREYDKHE